ncbi:hypothetical protein V0288_23255 [Pannus brasiliensis CCIBt3594]|uniref:Uncharacterized protein n=1 Tax=Pannus brasiliensis CCIBt3594 TaxID=1427578 RepID=A0AAW9QXZ7_9CHRO
MLLLLFMFSADAASAFKQKYLIFVGTYTGKGSDGIYSYRFDPDSGEAVGATRRLKALPNKEHKGVRSKKIGRHSQQTYLIENIKNMGSAKHVMINPKRNYSDG